jgi:mRNA interferase HigB
MHILSFKMLRDFWQKHPASENALRQWHSIVENVDFKDFGHIKAFYNSADYVPPFVVFDVAGNNYRVVVVVQYRAKRVYIREVLTHREYDVWCQRYRKGKV